MGLGFKAPTSLFQVIPGGVSQLFNKISDKVKTVSNSLSHMNTLKKVSSSKDGIVLELKDEP